MPQSRGVEKGEAVAQDGLHLAELVCVVGGEYDFHIFFQLGLSESRVR